MNAMLALIIGQASALINFFLAGKKSWLPSLLRWKRQAEARRAQRYPRGETMKSNLRISTVLMCGALFIATPALAGGLLGGGGLGGLGGGLGGLGGAGSSGMGTLGGATDTSGSRITHSSSSNTHAHGNASANGNPQQARRNRPPGRRRASPMARLQRAPRLVDRRSVRAPALPMAQARLREAARRTQTRDWAI